MRALGKIEAKADADPEIASILKLVASVFKAPASLCALFNDKEVSALTRLSLLLLLNQYQSLIDSKASRLETH